MDVKPIARRQDIPANNVRTPILQGALAGIVVCVLVAFGYEWKPTSTVPWALVTLLTIAGASLRWGSVAGLATLIVIAIEAGIVSPLTGIPFFAQQAANWHAFIARYVLFMSCGGIMVAMTHESRKLREEGIRKAAVMRSLQAMMLPDNLAEPPGYKTACLYRPAKVEDGVGGDFYDLFAIPGTDKHIVCIGDVSGKGKEAAASIAMMRYGIRSFASLGYGPPEILSAVNRMTVNDPDLKFTATLFLGLLDARTGCLHYSSAGHEPPIVVKEAKEAVVLDHVDIMLGVIDDYEYRTTWVTVEPGDSLYLMTDGVTEARDSSGKFLDAAGAATFADRANSRKSPHEVLRHIEEQLTVFTDNHFHDDVALVVIRRAV